MDKLVYDGEQLVQLGKNDLLSETFTNSNGEIFANVNNSLCYISKPVRELYESFEVSGLQAVEIELADGKKLLRLQKPSIKQAAPKKGNWH